jgi:hypothetical protein
MGSPTMTKRLSCVLRKLTNGVNSAIS